MYVWLVVGMGDEGDPNITDLCPGWLPLLQTSNPQFMEFPQMEVYLAYT